MCHCQLWSGGDGIGKQTSQLVNSTFLDADVLMRNEVADWRAMGATCVADCTGMKHGKPLVFPFVVHMCILTWGAPSQLVILV